MVSIFMIWPIVNIIGTQQLRAPARNGLGGPGRARGLGARVVTDVAIPCHVLGLARVPFGSWREPGTRA